MKQTLFYLLFLAIFSFLFTSCQKEEEDFNELFLVGKWQSGTLFYKYQANGTGGTWDTADDVTEAEAQAFTWTLVKSGLTHNHVQEMGGSVPQFYTVTELTATSLKYRDFMGKRFSFTKVVN